MQEQELFSYIDSFYVSVAFIIEAFLLFMLGKWVFSLFHPKVKIREELVEKDNFAFSISHTGYFIGLLLAIGAAVHGPSSGFLVDLVEIGIWGIYAIILLNISIIINDKLILRKFSVYKEIIEDQNEGTGIVEAANMVASGLIIYGAFTGSVADVDGTLTGIYHSFVFWLLGQLAIFIVTIVYQWSTPYDIHEYIEKDNVAVGLGFAGAIVAIGNLVRFGIGDEFVSWSFQLISITFDVFLGLILLPVIRLLTDKILLPGRNITDELINQDKPNIGSGLIEAFAYIGGSVLITWCL